MKKTPVFGDDLLLHPLNLKFYNLAKPDPEYDRYSVVCTTPVKDEDLTTQPVIGDVIKSMYAVIEKAETHGYKSANFLAPDGKFRQDIRKPFDNDKVIDQPRDDDTGAPATYKILDDAIKISAASKKAVAVLDRTNAPLAPDDYPQYGDIVGIRVTPMVWNNNAQFGISFLLKSVTLIQRKPEEATSAVDVGFPQEILDKYK